MHSPAGDTVEVELPDDAVGGATIGVEVPAATGADRVVETRPLEGEATEEDGVMQVQVPPGTIAGEIMHMLSPRGDTIELQLPAGYAGGDTIDVHYPVEEDAEPTEEESAEAQNDHEVPLIEATFTELGSLGLSFEADTPKDQPKIKEIKPDTQAVQHAQLGVGMVLAEVAGTPCQGVPYADCIQLVVAHPQRPIVLKFEQPEAEEDRDSCLSGVGAAATQQRLRSHAAASLWSLSRRVSSRASM